MDGSLQHDADPPGPRGRLTIEQFCEQLPDQAAVQAARQLIAAAKKCGAIVNRKQGSLTVTVQTAIRAAPLTVAWLFPTMTSSWGGLKGFTIGQVNWVELPEETQAKLEELFGRMSRDSFTERVGSDKPGGSRGWAVDPAVAAQHISLIEKRLVDAISILKAL